MKIEITIELNNNVYVRATTEFKDEFKFEQKFAHVCEQLTELIKTQKESEDDHQPRNL